MVPKNCFITKFDFPRGIWLNQLCLGMGIIAIKIRYLGIGYGYGCDTHTQYSENITYECMLDTNLENFIFSY